MKFIAVMMALQRWLLLLTVLGRTAAVLAPPLPPLPIEEAIEEHKFNTDGSPDEALQLSLFDRASKEVLAEEITTITGTSSELIKSTPTPPVQLPPKKPVKRVGPPSIRPPVLATTTTEEAEGSEEIITTEKITTTMTTTPITTTTTDAQTKILTSTTMIPISTITTTRIPTSTITTTMTPTSTITTTSSSTTTSIPTMTITPSTITTTIISEFTEEPRVLIPVPREELASRKLFFPERKEEEEEIDKKVPVPNSQIEEEPLVLIPPPGDSHEKNSHPTMTLFPQKEFPKEPKVLVPVPEDFQEDVSTFHETISTPLKDGEPRLFISSTTQPQESIKETKILLPESQESFFSREPLVTIPLPDNVPITPTVTPTTFDFAAETSTENIFNTSVTSQPFVEELKITEAEMLNDLVKNLPMLSAVGETTPVPVTSTHFSHSTRRVGDVVLAPARTLHRGQLRKFRRKGNRGHERKFSRARPHSRTTQHPLPTSSTVTHRPTIIHKVRRLRKKVVRGLSRTRIFNNLN